MPPRSHGPRTLALLAPLLLSCAAGAAPPPRLEDGIERELDRLSSTLERAAAAALPEAIAAQIEPQRQALAAARKIASPELLLHRLSDVAVGIETLGFVAAHRDAGSDLARFEALWAEHAPRFATPPAAALSDGPSAVPPLAIALASAAENRAGKLYRASLPYGRAASPLSGLYYLAQAEGELALRDLVDRLAVDLPGEAVPAPSRARVEAALANLDAELLTLFAAQPGGRELVPFSARLKEARELLDADRLEAAALTLLDARLALGRRRLDGDAGRSPIAATGAAEPAPAPGSLAAPFAALALETADASTREIVRGEVLPLYRDLTTIAPRGAP